MEQWLTLMPRNREAAGSNLSGGLAFSKSAYYEVGYCGKKNFLSWTAMHIDFVMCKNQNAGHNQQFFKPTELIPHGSTLK